MACGADAAMCLANQHRGLTHEKPTDRGRLHGVQRIALDPTRCDVMATSEVRVMRSSVPGEPQSAGEIDSREANRSEGRRPCAPGQRQAISTQLPSSGCLRGDW